MSSSMPRTWPRGPPYRLAPAPTPSELVSNLPQERASLAEVRLRFDGLRSLAVHDSHDAPSAGRLRDQHGQRVRGGREHRHDLRHVADRAEQVDWERVPKEDDERVARPDLEGVPRRQVLQRGVRPFCADEARTGG